MAESRASAGVRARAREGDGWTDRWRTARAGVCEGGWLRTALAGTGGRAWIGEGRVA